MKIFKKKNKEFKSLEHNRIYYKTKKLLKIDFIYNFSFFFWMSLIIYYDKFSGGLTLFTDNELFFKLVMTSFIFILISFKEKNSIIINDNLNQLEMIKNA
jgi:magnesium-transporting ATPase (P-type)